MMDKNILNDQLGFDINQKLEHKEYLKIKRFSENMTYTLVLVGAALCFVIFCLLLCVLVLGLTGKLTSTKQINSNPRMLSTERELSEPTCGKSFYKSKFFSLNSRIIKGEEAVAHSEPWIVSLRKVLQDGSLSNHICGASLIDDQFVLSAAHCVANRIQENLAVLVGLHSINSFTQEFVYYIDKVYIHEDFNNNGLFNNDIAILKLKNKITKSSRVSIICLPDNDEALIGLNVITSGWGVNTDKSSIQYPNNLQTTLLTVINGDSICFKDYNYNPDTKFCTIGQDKQLQSNVCNGKLKKKTRY